MKTNTPKPTLLRLSAALDSIVTIAASSGEVKKIYSVMAAWTKMAV